MLPRFLRLNQVRAEAFGLLLRLRERFLDASVLLFQDPLRFRCSRKRRVGAGEWSAQWVNESTRGVGAPGELLIRLQQVVVSRLEAVQPLEQLAVLLTRLGAGPLQLREHRLGVLVLLA